MQTFFQLYQRLCKMYWNFLGHRLKEENRSMVTFSILKGYLNFNMFEQSIQIHINLIALCTTCEQKKKKSNVIDVSKYNESIIIIIMCL